MSNLDADIARTALAQHHLITTRQLRELGASRSMIDRRVRSGRYLQVEVGVLLVGLGPPSWTQHLHAAVLAPGPHAVASHRAAIVRFGLDGIARAPVEITVPHTTEAVIRSGVVHRSRRLEAQDVSVRGGIPITRVERTLCDAGRFLPPRTLQKCLESAIRKGLTSAEACWTYATERGKPLPGADVLERILLKRPPGRAAGSSGEVELLDCLRRFGIPDPVRQYEVQIPPDIQFNLDLAWPWAKAGVEWDSYEFHADQLAYEATLERRNLLQLAGWSIIGYGGGLLRRDPELVARQVAQLVGGGRVA